MKEIYTWSTVKTICSIDWIIYGLVQINLILFRNQSVQTSEYVRRDISSECWEMLVITYNNSLEEVNSEDEFDKIEILSSQIDTADEFFLAPIASLTEKEVDLLERKERERKRIARAVALVSGILFLVSVALVTVSLYMAKDIDEMGRFLFLNFIVKTYLLRYCLID